jgi:tRNA A-37 threonylcarbamoyl transferase component Bud32
MIQNSAAMYKKLNSIFYEEYFNSFKKYDLAGYTIVSSPLFEEIWQNNLISILKDSSTIRKVLKQKANVVFEKEFPFKNPLKLEKIIIKKFVHRSFFHFIISCIKISKAKRHFIAARHLIQNQLDTPVPLAYVEKRKFGFILECYFISESIKTPEKISKLVKKENDDVKLMTELIELTAQYTKKMHDSGMVHNDLNLANFLLSGNNSEKRLVLIDLNRSRIKNKISPPLRLKDIVRLGWKNYRNKFLEDYCNNYPAYKNWIWYYYFYLNLRRKKKKIRKLKKSHAGNHKKNY